jgi:hypothetical protein
MAEDTIRQLGAERPIETVEELVFLLRPLIHPRELDRVHIRTPVVQALVRG